MSYYTFSASVCDGIYIKYILSNNINKNKSFFIYHAILLPFVY